MKRFSEQSSGVQWASLAAIITLLTGGAGAAALWAADAKIDEKFATDADVKAVQETTSAQVKAIRETVEQNTKTLSRTAGSVDGLTLVVLDLQIEKIETEVIALEADKRAAGASWSTGDESTLRAKQKAVDDLRLQRNKLFDRMLEQ